MGEALRRSLPCPALSQGPYSVSLRQMPSTYGAPLALKDKEPYIRSVSSQNNQRDVNFGSKKVSPS